MQSPTAADAARSLHRPHRAVGSGEVAGDSRARRSRLLLRRQPAHRARADTRRAVAARRRRASRRWPSSSTFARAASCGSFARVWRKLKAMPGLDPRLIFLEASHDALVRRFSETRRPHPLALDRPVVEGIRSERRQMAKIRALADQIVDTTHLTVHQLREQFQAFARTRIRRRRWSSRFSASASSSGCPWTPTSCSTCAFCPTRTSFRR